MGYLTAATAPAQVPTLFLGVIPVPHVVSTNADAFAVLRQLHRALAVTLIALASAHALAAVHNHLQGRATLTRMWRGA
jgi:cytochrome b561